MCISYGENKFVVFIYYFVIAVGDDDGNADAMPRLTPREPKLGISPLSSEGREGKGGVLGL